MPCDLLEKLAHIAAPSCKIVKERRRRSRCPEASHRFHHAFTRRVRPRPSRHCLHPVIAPGGRLMHACPRPSSRQCASQHTQRRSAPLSALPTHRARAAGPLLRVRAPPFRAPPTRRAAPCSAPCARFSSLFAPSRSPASTARVSHTAHAGYHYTVLHARASGARAYWGAYVGLVALSLAERKGAQMARATERIVRNAIKFVGSRTNKELLSLLCRE